MEIEVKFLADGSVQVVVPQQSGLSFAEARARLKIFAADLGILGLPIEFVGDVEQHSHGPETLGAHTHQTAR